MDILTIRLLRREPGDTGIPDIPFPGADISEAERVAEERLRSHFHERGRPDHKRPLQAIVFDQKGHALALFQMTMAGDVEKLPPGALNAKRT